MHRTEITLVRHGESTDELNTTTITGRAKEAELTAQGIAQTMALGLSWAVEGYEPDKYYTSPLPRAIRSGKMALRAAGRSERLRADRNIIEQSFGVHEGQSTVQVYEDPVVLSAMRQESTEYMRPGLTPDGSEGESLYKVSSRVMHFLSVFRGNANHMTEPASSAVFGHDIPFRIALARISLVGFRTGQVNPHELQAAYDEHPELPAGSQTKLILEGGPHRDSIVCHVEATREIEPRYLDAIASMAA